MQSEPGGENEDSDKFLGLQLRARPVVYAIVRERYDTSEALATVREAEGLTVIVDQEVAEDDGLAYQFVGAWITVRESTALNAVGITAELSAALAEADIACNVIAGFHHDHLIVAWEERHSALAALGSQHGPKE